MSRWPSNLHLITSVIPTRRLGAVLCSTIFALPLACSGNGDLNLDETQLGVAVTEPGFYFFPPFGTMTTSPTSWAPGALAHLSLRLEAVNPTNGQVLQHLHTYTSATSPRILRGDEAEAFGLGWNAAADSLIEGTTYRVTVLAEGRVLGHSDIHPQFIPAIRHKSDLWIKFRVEQRAIDGDLDGVSDWEDHCPTFYAPENPTQSAETCDQLDNDCDGMIDEGNPGGGINCTTGQLGLCSAGTTACRSTGVICMRNVGPSTETCDNLDNDCDGAVDEFNAGGGSSCSTGQLGVCAAGTMTCQNGGLVCIRNVAPAAESCGDNVDNDCDGAPDEDCTPPPEGIIHWWQADGNADDHLGGPAGTLGSTTFVAGHRNQAFNFDGSTFVDLPTDAPTLALRTGSLSLWFQIQDLSQQAFLFSVAQIGAAFPSGGQWTLDYNQNGHQLRATCSSNGQVLLSSNTPANSVNDNNWHHVVVVANNTATLRVYIDGVQLQLSSNAGRFFGHAANTNNMKIGALRSNTLNTAGRKAVDEVQIYNRALSTTEVQAIFNAR